MRFDLADVLFAYTIHIPVPVALNGLYSLNHRKKNILVFNQFKA